MVMCLGLCLMVWNLVLELDGGRSLLVSSYVSYNWVVVYTCVSYKWEVFGFVQHPIFLVYLIF